MYDLLNILVSFFPVSFGYFIQSHEHFEEIGIDKLAAVINEMDSDDAVDLLEEIDESVKEKLRPILHEDVKADIQLIHSYDEEEIGSLMTTNYICIKKTLNIRHRQVKTTIFQRFMLWMRIINSVVRLI